MLLGVVSHNPKVLALYIFVACSRGDTKTSQPKEIRACLIFLFCPYLLFGSVVVL